MKSEEIFQQIYDEEFDKALYVWLDYYITTEAFDRILPGMWSQHDNDCWIPIIGKHISIAHARERWAQAQSKLKALNICAPASERARKYAVQHSYTKSKELIKHLRVI